MEEVTEIKYEYDHGEVYLYFIRDDGKKELHRKATADERSAFSDGIVYGLSLARMRIRDGIDKVIGNW